DLAERASAYGIPGVRVDGFDPLAVYRAASEAVERARGEKGPTLLVTDSYRLEGHYAGEPEAYRTRAEVAEQRKNDPIPRFRARLAEEFHLSEEVIAGIEGEIAKEIQESVRFAKESPEPDASTALDFIYA
ncbi:MAG: pyruvate dehydrogenase (acetyl-transferring) E1 component subunit alpha, partial [Acidobacteria bacterium]